MPNHTYSTISVEEKYTDKLKAIAEVGLCRYYFPMPEELEGSKSGSESIKPEWQKKRSRELKSKYGFDNWYDWCCHNWGTKWGCYDSQIDGGVYDFVSAWCPPGTNVIEALAKDIPSFVFTFEEETGWGGEHQYQDGKLLDKFEYDSPDWEEVGEQNDRDGYGVSITKLSKPYRNSEGNFDAGYYADYCLQEYLADNLEDALELLRK